MVRLVLDKPRLVRDKPRLVPDEPSRQPFQPAPDVSIADPADVTPVATARPIAAEPTPSILIPDTIPPAPGTPQTIGRPPEHPIDERWLAYEADADKMDKLLKHPASKFFGLRATQFDDTVEGGHLRRALGRTAYLGTKLVTGLMLYTPELVFGPDLAERIHKVASGFEMAPDEKMVGDMVEFVAGLRTAGKLVEPLASMMPAREVLRLTTGGGATFMLRNLSEQTVDRLRKGEKISITELLGETMVGATIGAARAGGRQLERYVRWAKTARADAVGQQVPRRLWMRTDEALRAAAEGMPQATWDKIYKADVDMWAQSYADAYNSMTNWTTAGYKGAADTAGIVRGADMPRAGRRAAAPVVKKLPTTTVVPMKPEPQLFLPMTQLMKRVPTPGVIPPKRRVLIPQPTALATVKKWERLKSEVGPSGKPLEMPKNAIQKWTLDYMYTRNSDVERIYGFNPGFVPKDPSFVRRRFETLRTMTKQQEKYAKRYQRKLDAGVEPRKINVLNPVVSARYMWMQIDDRYGVPVWLTANHMYNEVGKGVVDADDAVRAVVQARHTVGITKADDDMIADWLFSNEAGRNALADKMSEDALMLAMKEDELLQGYVANQMKMMIAGRWIDTGDMPADIKHYIPNKAMAEGYKKRVLAEAKAADDADTLLEHVTNVEPWKSGLGIRKYYYMSSPDEADIIDDTLFRMSPGVFEAPPNRTNLPGTYSYEARPRKGTPKRKTGSTLNNIYNKATRVSALNRARKDMRILSDRLQYVQLSDADKSSLNGMLNNLLRKHSLPKRGFGLPIKIKRIYWTTSFSPLVRPGTAIYRIIRNSPQNIAFGPYGLNIPEALKHAALLTDNRGNLEAYDSEMMKRYNANFAANVSQRKAMWTEFYMQDAAKITSDFSRTALTNHAIEILERTGTGYMAVDEFSRKCIWMTQYQVVKSAMNDFLAGKINQNQFYNRTRLDTVHRQQQLLVHDMVSNGRVDDMAELAADWITEDVNMKYKTESRSLIEQSPEERVFFGPITFNRGRLEHGYYRGVRALMDGISEGNPGKAYRGSTNIIKGVTASALVSAGLAYITGRRAYSISKALNFSLLDPGTSRVHAAAERTFYNMYRYNNNEQGLLSTIDNIADAWSEIGEALFVPFSIEAADIYESVKDKKNVTSYRIIRNGVAAKLGIEEREFDSVSRTRRQAIVHALFGSYEYVPKEPTIEGRGTRGTRGTR